MSRSLSYLAWFFLLAFAFWLLYRYAPWFSSENAPSQPKAIVPVEPKFRHEGQLAILDSNGRDTLAELAIELADSPEEIMYGMMYRKSMADFSGMLFLMPEERPQSFYMKNTYVSLDIIYINSKNRIVSIQKNAEPLNERSLPSGAPASMVLEVPGGFCDREGIAAGQSIRYQRFTAP